MDLANISPVKLWKGGFIYGFFFEKGLYDDQPLNDFILHRFSGRKLKKHLNIAVTNVLTGAFTSFTERHPPDELIKILQASVSFSGITPAIEAFDSLYFSGSAIYENDVMAAINHCESLGYAEADIVIDAIVGGSTTVPKYDGAKANTFSIM